MKLRLPKLKRSAYIAVSSVLVVVSILSGLRPQPAYAAPLTSRSIRISKSAIGTSSAGQDVIYRIGFTIPASVNVGGMAIDFCSNSPLIGETCTAAAGLNTNEGTTTINTQSGITDFAIDAATDANTIILTRTAAAASGAVSFLLGTGTGGNGFTNPTAVGTFYGRLYTYTTTAAAQGHNEDAAAGYQDYGGIALSTAAVINITARVQETLSFCVYPDDDGGGPASGTCGDAPNITIGHDNGAGTFIIDSTQVDESFVHFSLSTNASGGAIVRMKGDTLKDSVTPTPNDINAKGTPAATFAGGEEGFGLRISTAGGMTAVAPYNGGAAAYALVVSGGGTNDVTSTFGAEIASVAAPVNNSVTTIEFAAQASNTTPAGVYTASEQLISTGTF
jgi:hypothetical protein